MKKASLVLLSNAIFDSIHDKPFAGGIAICGDLIEFVGSKKDIEKYVGPYTVIRDFGEKLIMPGFIDSHAHFDGSVNKYCADIADDLEECKSEEEVVEEVVAFAEKHPNLKRINGSGWNFNNWSAHPYPPTRKSLDRAFPNTPVYLFGYDGHTNWVNSKAIEECKLAEIVSAHPEYPQVYAPKDENGEFTGFLTESASFAVHLFAETYPPDLRAEYQARFIKLLGTYGLTSFTDASALAGPKLAEQFHNIKSMENNGTLTARVFIWPGCLLANTADRVAAEMEDIQSYEAFFCSDMLRIAGMKTMMDGVDSCYTAAMLEPYTDKPDVKGNFKSSPENYHAWVNEANRRGYSCKIHCIGDASVRLALDCYEESNAINNNGNLRNSIEHDENVNEADEPRFARLGVIANMQPAHVLTDKDRAVSYLGEERSRRKWGFRRLVDAGTTIAISTDCPVVEIDPYLTIYKSVTRLDVNGEKYNKYDTLNQALNLPETLKAYTIGGAYANGMDHKLGTIEAGKYADITIADRNLFAIPASEIKDCHSVCTVFNGKIVFEA